MYVSPYSTSFRFQHWEGAQNLIFCKEFESKFWQKWQGMDHESRVYAVQSSSNYHHTFAKVIKHLSSNGCLSLQHIIPLSLLIGYPISDILHEIWEWE